MKYGQPILSMVAALSITIVGFIVIIETAAVATVPFFNLFMRHNVTLIVLGFLPVLLSLVVLYRRVSLAKAQPGVQADGLEVSSGPDVSQ